ncbi:MAG: ATPase [Bacteroides sp.]|nr:ATPase [Bacteroides sp.]
MPSYSTLIADAGSTKVEWAIVKDKISREARFTTTGINALISSDDDIRATLHEVTEKIGENVIINRIFYYGAGCATPAICKKLTSSIQEIWPDATVYVASDLEGAAKSLLGKSDGIACILGTGSNSALFDGEKIVMNIPPLGFILGDEGSGTALGKRLIKEIYKSDIPSDLKTLFFSETDLSLPEILDKVYRSPAPNKFIASLVPFIRKHIEHPLINNMVIEEFKEFFRRNVSLYPDAKEKPVSFTGSVAFYFEPQLREAAQAEGFFTDKITNTPMDGLISYHLS